MCEDAREGAEEGGWKEGVWVDINVKTHRVTCFGSSMSAQHDGDCKETLWMGLIKKKSYVSQCLSNI